MTAHIINRLAGPMSIYAVTAAYCWLTPSRLTDEDGTVIINIFPTRAFAVASAALVVVHLALSFRGRMAFAVAAIWAFATISTVTMFALLSLVAWPTWSTFELAQAGLVAAAACALCALAWQVARRPLPDNHPIARALVALGLVLLAICYGTLALRVVGVLRRPEGFAQLAEVTADLTVSLWIASAILLLGAAVHTVLPRRAQLNAA
jgi:hypothetical protein